MERALRLIIFAIFVFLILKATTFGWNFWGDAVPSFKRIDSRLAQNLKDHVHRLAQGIGERSLFKYESLKEAEKYITGEFISFGYNVEFQEYKVEEKLVKNIIAKKLGSQDPEETIIIGAHYDTCFNPGADDNASGLAGLLELARYFSGKKTKQTIQFVAFVNEEPPFFKTEDMGSRVYAEAAKAQNNKIRAVIILESIGYYSSVFNSQRYPPLLGFFYPNRGNFIAVVGNLHSRNLARDITTGFRKSSWLSINTAVLPNFISGVDFSDHWSFWKEGYPAVMLTDTAFLRNPHYHKQSDTWEKLDYSYMAELVKGCREVLIQLDNRQ